MTVAFRGGPFLVGPLRLLVLLFAARALEIALGVFPWALPTRIDLFVLIAAVGSFGRGAMGGAYFGFAVGLFRAVAGPEPVGPTVVSTALAAAFAAWAHRKLVGESTLGLFLILVGAVLVHDAIRLSGFLREAPGVFAQLFAARSIPAGLATAALGAFGHEARARRNRRSRRRRMEAAA